MATDRDCQLNVEITSSYDLDLIDIPRLAELMRFAAGRVNCEGTLGILLCTDFEISELHRNFMGIDSPTDVLSFEGDETDGEVHLGDVAVSVETASAQAPDAGHSPEREIAFLCLHGLLHLCGFDDLDPDERRKMLDCQEEILRAFERQDSRD